MKKIVNKKVLATMVCLSLSAGTAYAAELEKEHIEIPDIQAGQEFYIDTQGKVIFGSYQPEVSSVDNTDDIEECDDEYMLKVLRPRMHMTKDKKIVIDRFESKATLSTDEMVIYNHVSYNNENKNDVVKNVVTTYGTVNRTIIGDNADSSINPHQNSDDIREDKPLPESIALLEDISTEHSNVAEQQEIKNETLKNISSAGEVKRDQAEAEMSQLLDRSISRSGVELMVTMLNRNTEISRIDKLNCYIGYCRAINNKSIPMDVKAALLQAMTNIFE